MLFNAMLFQGDIESHLQYFLWLCSYYVYAQGVFDKNRGFWQRQIPLFIIIVLNDFLSGNLRLIVEIRLVTNNWLFERRYFFWHVLTRIDKNLLSFLCIESYNILQGLKFLTTDPFTCLSYILMSQTYLLQKLCTVSS